MAYGKYAPKSTIQPSQPTNYVDDFQANGLLGLVGKILMDNYNRRGEQKANATANEILAKNGLGGAVIPETPTPSAALTDDYTNAINQNATANLKEGLDVTAPDTATLAAQGQRGQLPSLNPQGASADGSVMPEPIAPSQGLTKQYFDMNGQQTADALTPQALQPQPRDIAAEKVDYAWNKYNQGSDNPAADKRLAGDIANDVAKTASTVNMGFMPTFDKAGVRNQIIAQLRKDGRTQYQIDRALEDVAPVIDQAEEKWKQQRMGVLSEAYNINVNAGDYAAAQATVAQMASVDPQVAGVYGAGLVTAKDVFNANQKQDLMGLQHKFDIDKLNITGAQRAQLAQMQGQLQNSAQMRALEQKFQLGRMAGYSDQEIARLLLGGGKPDDGNGQNINSKLKEDLKYWESDAEKWKKEHGAENLENYPYLDELRAARASHAVAPEDVTRFNRAEPYIKSGGFYRTNDYDKAITHWTRMLERNAQESVADRWSPAEMATLARAMYGANAENIIKNTDWSQFGLGKKQ